MSTTRYPGIASFEDNDILSRLFFGREEESKLLLFSILSEYITVLFSKSGYGKTSLLQADVFRKLRERGYYPILVRFNKKQLTPTQVVISEVKDLAAKDTTNEIVVPGDEADLRKFFDKLSIWSPDDKLLHPVLIFDQFEEIFTLKHNASVQHLFFEELADVANACKDGELSLKMVFSIREDFLGHLERLSVKIPSIFTNRFRLEALSKANAGKAITIPASIVLEGVEFSSPPFYYSDGAIKALLEFLSLEMIEGKWEPTPYIEPVQLQIICSELESRVRNGGIKKKDGKLTIRTEDLGGNEGLREILGHFYDTQLARLKTELGLSNREITALRNLIEVGLISGKRRVPVDYDTVIGTAEIRKEAIDLLISSKLLKEVTLGSSSLVEISHDSLIEPVLESYEIRRRAEVLALEAARLKRKRNKIIRGTVATATLILLVMAGWAYYERDRADKASKRADDVTAQLEKATDALGNARDSLKGIKRQGPIVIRIPDTTHLYPVAGNDFITPTLAPLTPQPPPLNPPLPQEVAIVGQDIFHDPNSTFISISADGTKIIAANKFGHSHLYDIKGDLKETYTQPRPLTAFDFSVAGIALIASGDGGMNLLDKNNVWSGRLDSGGVAVTAACFSPQFGSPRYRKNILVCTADGRARLLDLAGNTIKTFDAGERVSTVAFSADGKKVITGSADGSVRVWPTSGDELPETFISSTGGAITAIALSGDEQKLATGNGDGNMTVWDMKTKAVLLTIGQNRKVSTLTFRKNADKVYAGYADGAVRLYNISYERPDRARLLATKEYKGHTGAIQSMYFRESDNKLFTTSADGSARIWTGP